MEQAQNLRNTLWNRDGTFSLKALANKVFGRNEGWNKQGTEALKPVPLGSQHSLACGTNSQDGYNGVAEELLYEFNERAAILEHEAASAEKRQRGWPRLTQKKICTKIVPPVA